MGTEMIAGRWGTWEELLLGGAVLRHGTQDWNLVASELRARTVSAFAFTPEVCKAKYEDLQHRYSGGTAWFDELRKQRMAELRRALVKSEDSIGSLESKLENLKAEKRVDSRVDYDSSQTESAVPCLKSEGIEFSSKDTSKDGLSAGSFTQEAPTNWSPRCQVPAAVPAEEMDLKPGDSPISEREKFSSIDRLADTLQFRSIRKRTGKRKRKDCSKPDAKEGSVGESEFLGPTDVASVSPYKETSASNSAPIARSSGIEEDQSRVSGKEGSCDDIMGIFSSVSVNDCASVFRRRLDSQKRGRYKKMILRHMDFDTIRTRIASNSIMSVKELFRDMLLVATNALVFYSKNTREYKSALLLRHVVTTALRQRFKECGSQVHVTMHKPPAKPRSIRPANRKQVLGKATDDHGNRIVVGVSDTSKNMTTKVDSSPSPAPESLPVTKNCSSRPRKVGGRGRAIQKLESPLKGRKRTRAR